MTIFFALAAVIFFFLAFSFVFLRVYARRVEKKRMLFIEALWRRRNTIPLLLSILARAAPGEGATERQKIIELRSKVLGSAYALEEEIIIEKELTDLIEKLFRNTSDVPSLKADALLLSLRHEFREMLENARITLNDYNFAIEQFFKYSRVPPFIFLVFPFEARKMKALEPF